MLAETAVRVLVPIAIAAWGVWIVRYGKRLDRRGWEPAPMMVLGGYSVVAIGLYSFVYGLTQIT